MKRFVVYPDYMLEDMIQVVNRKEPFYLHSVLWIICGIFLGILCFICFGKMDEAVRADGVVRPEKNVSIVYNVISGEIEDLFYKPGDYVYDIQLTYGDGLVYTVIAKATLRIQEEVE